MDLTLLTYESFYFELEQIWRIVHLGISFHLIYCLGEIKLHFVGDFYRMLSCMLYGESSCTVLYLAIEFKLDWLSNLNRLIKNFRSYWQAPSFGFEVGLARARHLTYTYKVITYLIITDTFHKTSYVSLTDYHSTHSDLIFFIIILI